MRWLKRLFSAAPPAPPILLRIAGASPAMVEVEATWLPSGRRTTRSLPTSSGMCVMPWVGNATQVRLAVRAAGRAGELSLGRDHQGRVQDLALG